MASTKGGHFFTVNCSCWNTVLNAFIGMDLNQLGKPCTAGAGRGRIGSSSGGQRKVMVRSSLTLLSIDHWSGLHGTERPPPLAREQTWVLAFAGTSGCCTNAMRALT